MNCVAATFVMAQATDINPKPPEGRSQAISFGIAIPLGNFAATHFGGLTVEYLWSKNRFRQPKTKPVKSFGFIATGGLVYYAGKKETISGYLYDYPGYFFLHAFGGMLYNPVKNGSVTLTAGPALGIYNGNTKFNIGSKLEVSHYISKKIAIGPGIILMKESGADPIWATSLKATLNL